VFGIGGLGHLAPHYARVFGAETVAVDIEDAKLELARELGADAIVNARTADPVAAIEALGGADVAIALAANPTVPAQAHASLRRGGRLVLVSMPRDNALPLPIFETVVKGISVIGSIVGTRQDLADVFRLHAVGRTRVITQAPKLDEINACFDEVRPGAGAPGVRALGGHCGRCGRRLSGGLG